MSSNARTGGQRLAFIDWTRGLAALIMLQGHVFHSFTARELRNDGPYVLSQFIGGITPAVFLFLTGVTLGFLMDSASRKGLSPWQRTWPPRGAPAICCCWPCCSASRCGRSLSARARGRICSRWTS